MVVYCSTHILHSVILFCFLFFWGTFFLCNYLSQSLDIDILAQALYRYNTWTDPSNRFIKLGIPSHDHRMVTVFYSFRSFLCQLYTYLHNALDFNINLYFYLTFLLFDTDHLSFYITKLRADGSLVIGYQSVSSQCSVKLLHG